jgi:tRNA dimethylallyltransferase
MEDKALFSTRQLAKRQYTWLRSLQEKHKFKTYFTLEQAHEDLRNCHG